MMRFLKRVRQGHLSMDNTFERDQTAIDAMIGDF
ncbi:hypothetical protein BY998_1361 [Methylobacterium sp. B4]|nr:hypothetical protein BY998_1361 [Methylobacterium sp. B4]